MTETNVPSLNVYQTRKRLGVKQLPAAWKLDEQRAWLWAECQRRGVLPVGYPASKDARLDTSPYARG